MACLMTVPFGIAIATAYLYHAGFVIRDGDEQFATDTLKDLLLESGETSVWVGRVSRNVRNFSLTGHEIHF